MSPREKRVKQDRAIAIRAIRGHFWKAVREDGELSWLGDPSASTAARILELTLGRMQDRREAEESWRLFLSESC
jgi:hypothetical protein